MDTYKVIDISPVLHSGTAVFPGDKAFSRHVTQEISQGDNLTLSHIETTLHLGAHADAPSHYSHHGESIDRRPLELYLGPVQVIHVPGARGRRLLVSDMKVKNIQAPRVLFKTGTFPNPNKWNADFAALSAELVNYLAYSKVRLVGIDTPSIDPSEDTLLESHQAVAANDMAILEGLVLEAVEEGLYQLIALPLALKDADASPVRAVLLEKK